MIGIQRSRRKWYTAGKEPEDMPASGMRAGGTLQTGHL